METLNSLNTKIRDEKRKPISAESLKRARELQTEKKELIAKQQGIKKDIDGKD